MVLLGCRPKGRFTEQHDVFFGIATSLKKLIPHMKACWTEAKGKIHVDAWREVTEQDGYAISVVAKEQAIESKQTLFFINLGGYKRNEFEEYHYKMLTVAKNSAIAIKQAKKVSFYKHTGFTEAPSHIDDKYGIDVDDVYSLKEILAPVFKELYTLQFKQKEKDTDIIHLGYLKLDKIKD
jgi:hypothetical protein